MVLAAHDRRHRASRPGRRGHWIEGTSASATGGWRSSTCRRPASADGQRRQPLRAQLQRRDLQLPRAARGARGRGHRFRSQTDTEVVLNALRALGRRRAAALQRHVRVCAVGPHASADCCWRAIATASSRCTTRSRARRFAFGSEQKAILALPGIPNASSIKPGAARILHVSEFLHRPHAVRGCPTAAGRHYATLDLDRARPRLELHALLGLPLPRAGRSRSTQREYVRGARPAVPAGGQPAAGDRRRARQPTSAAAWTRARSPPSPRVAAHT